MLLLDSSFIIALLRQKPRALSIQKTFSTGIYTSAIVLAEIEVGLLRMGKNTQSIDEIISTVGGDLTILSVDRKVALQFARVQYDLMKQGLQLGQLDALIAATAMAHDLELVTFDADFKRVKGLKMYPSN